MNEKVQSLIREIVVVNNDRLALELSVMFQKRSQQAQRENFGGTMKTGFFYLVRDDRVSADTVLECVPSLDGGDAITALYRNHPANATIGAWIATRELLQQAIAGKVGLSVESVGIDDPSGRRRTLGLEELSTGQMLDVLGEKLGMSIMKTDNHAIEAPTSAGGIILQ